MPKVTLDVVVLNIEGLHARPAMQFVDVANRFASNVAVTKPTDDTGEIIDGKSVMGMITLGATQGTPLKIEADGDDAEAACQALKTLFDEKFGEE
ncbi:MAG: Phosphotransferase system, phosphocarrier protein HPr [Capsulimonas sp.]|nr:Phosphotransferase system, phosphocarrier protein HPr [Capsulimonas sp.]